jgi:anaphase-promoting complex subunit 2
VSKILSDDSSSDLLAEVLQLLRISQAVYFHPLKQHVLPKLSETDRYEFTKFQEGYDAMISVSLSKSNFAHHLAQFLKRQGSIVLGLDTDVPLQDENSMDVDQLSLVHDIRNETLHIMKCVDHVGLGGAQAQRILAEVMSELLTTHVNSTYAGQWTSPSMIPIQLDSWVENHFARFAVEVLACLRKSRKLAADEVSEITTTDLENWKKRAIGDLGALRLRELFDIVVEWDNNSRGAIEDLKKYITTPAARLHLTTSFSAGISHRLLQPGASTAQILQVYICIIRAFAVLDPKGVLLDRLARPIRRYLRDRDDTAKIIVGGLLADVTDEPGSTDVLVELAVELNKATEIAGDDDDGELDWDDMNWVPDPVDAGPGKGHHSRPPNHLLTLPKNTRSQRVTM